MSAGFIDQRADIIRHVGNDKQRLLLIGSIECVKSSCGYILEYHGVERLVPTKEKTSYGKENYISTKDVGEGVDTFFLRKEYGNKVLKIVRISNMGLY